MKQTHSFDGLTKAKASVDRVNAILGTKSSHIDCLESAPAKRLGRTFVLPFDGAVYDCFSLSPTTSVDV